MTDGAYNASRGIVGAATTANLDAAAIQMCDGMKAKGIEIYTVGYALNTLPAAEQSNATSTLQSCGSDIAHFYQSIDAAKRFQNHCLRNCGCRQRRSPNDVMA
jgi:hypothetical protein